MMSRKRYTDEFKKEAIKQVTELGYMGGVSCLRNPGLTRI